MPTISEALARGVEHHNAGQLAPAEAIYRAILAEQPDHPDALHLLGALALQSGRGDEAVALLERAAAVAPGNSEFQGDLAAAYIMVARPQEALAAAQAAIEQGFGRAADYFHHGLALAAVARFAEAVPSLRWATQLQPTLAAAHRQLGLALQATGALGEALPACQRALELEPAAAVSHFVLGTLLIDLGQPEAALARFEEAVRLEPDNPQWLCSRGLARLSLGHMAAGWHDYEHRRACPQFDILRLVEPIWDGQPLVGTLLVHCEQGLGDTLQFIRFARLARERCGRLIVAAQTALVPLLTLGNVGEIVSRSAPLPQFDAHVPLASLPRIFAADLDHLLADVPYLRAEPERVVRWRDELAGFPGLRVGIVWQGQRKFRTDHLRSMPLAYFAPLAQVPGVRLISLQKGGACLQIVELKGAFSVLDLSERIDNDDAFLDTAAIMQNLDLVATSDTAAAHLAGALGVPVWVALARGPDWRWLHGRADSPWYPTVRLFRQSEPGRWQDVFHEMAQSLASLSEKKSALQATP